MPTQRIRRLVAAALCAGMVGSVSGMAGCSRQEALVTVAGKTVYGEMAVEEAHVRALRQERDSEREAGTTHSGYHGSWVLRLPPGTYRLEAAASLPQAGPERLMLAGQLEGVSVRSGQGRVDRLVIPLAPRAAPPRPP